MRWTPPRNSARERKVAARLRRASRFYKFLWEIRRELFEDGFEGIRSTHPSWRKAAEPDRRGRLSRRG